MGKKDKQRQRKAAQRARRQKEKKARRAARSETETTRRASDSVIGVAYCTPPLAMRVSGRVELVLGVKRGEHKSQWTRVVSSLLSGGYKGSMGAEIDAPFEELVERGCPFESLPGGLAPVSIDDAKMLAGGMFAWAYAHGLLGDAKGYLPGLGALSPPPGNPEDWIHDVMSLFSDEQFEIAQAVAMSLKDQIEPGEEPIEREDIPVIVVFECETDRPLTLASELDRCPMEFVNDPKENDYEFHPRTREGGLLAGFEPLSGRVKLQGQTVSAMAASAINAAKLAARLEELAPGPLELKRVDWEVQFEDELGLL